MVQAIIAPVQTVHLRLLEQTLHPSGNLSLEAAVRSRLLPTETWGDMKQWRGNLRLVAWLRAAWFRAHPSSVAILPKATAAFEQRLGDLKSDAPTNEEARSLFGLDHPTGRARCSALTRAITRAESDAAPVRDDNGSTSAIPFDTVLEAAGGLIENRGAWAAYCEEHGVYELITRELADSLATHVASRTPALLSDVEADDDDDRYGDLDVDANGDVDSNAPAHAGMDENADDCRTLRVLEVGAGNGELAHYLRRALHARGVRATLTACDNGSWGLSARSRTFGTVELQSYRAALRKYRPHLVIAAWMPMGVDWTEDMRACPSVGEYILLGECYDGSCGENWCVHLPCLPACRAPLR